MASFMSEKITKSIYDLYKNRNTENDNDFDFFNVWTHFYKINNLISKKLWISYSQLLFNLKNFKNTILYSKSKKVK